MAIKAMKSGDPIDKNREFLINWYKNRVMPNFTSQMWYNMDKSKILNQLKNIPQTEFVDESGFIDVPFPVEGQYVPESRRILVKKGAAPDVETHEINHFLQDYNNQWSEGNESFSDNENARIIRNSLSPRMRMPEEYRGTEYEYFTHPKEIQSRLMSLRQRAGFKPDQVVTPKDLQEFWKTYKRDNGDIEDLLNITKDEKAMLDMLNGVSKVKQINLPGRENINLVQS